MELEKGNITQEEYIIGIKLEKKLIIKILKAYQKNSIIPINLNLNVLNQVFNFL